MINPAKLFETKKIGINKKLWYGTGTVSTVPVAEFLSIHLNLKKKKKRCSSKISGELEQIPRDDSCRTVVEHLSPSVCIYLYDNVNID